MKYKGLGSAVHLVQTFIAAILPDGGTAVDATAGNGYDTLFLARQVGPEGRVYAFDIQEKALSHTKALLERHGVAGRVTLLAAGHEVLGKLVPAQADAVLFNLGYLPGGDHSLVTKPDTTVAALQAAVGLLRQGGRIGLVLYTGHPGGAAELEAVVRFVSGLSSAVFNVLRIDYLNRAGPAPVSIIIEKVGVTA